MQAAWYLVKTFKVSCDPEFADNLLGAGELYLNLPNYAFVDVVDEKGQIQALDRTQPSLPFYLGRLGTITHDYKRHHDVICHVKYGKR